MKNYQSQIKSYIESEVQVLRSLDIDDINNVMNELEKAYNEANMVYIFGNGGSAATASHYTNDFNKGISEYTSKKFKFVCLNDNVATITAIANDLDYTQIFEFQLKGKLEKNDVVIGISGSGNSKNILRAIEYANKIGAKTIGISGFDGGQLKKICNISLNVPVNNMQISEDVHMIFDHLMMTIFSKELANRNCKE